MLIDVFSTTMQQLIAASFKLSAAGTIPFKGNQTIHIQGWFAVRVHGPGMRFSFHPNNLRKMLVIVSFLALCFLNFFPYGTGC
jgi:hypothetical protein